MKKIGSVLKKHVMTSISYLIPLVIASGIMLAIGNILSGANVADLSSTRLNIADLCTTVGAYGIGLIPMVIATGVSFSIADKPGIAPGILVGMVAQNLSTGFLGGLLGGFISGGITLLIVKKVKVPSFMQGLMPTLFIPLIASLISCTFIYYVIGTPVIYLTQVLTNYLQSLSTSSLFIYGAIIGVMGGIDFGGALNKITFAFALGLQTEGFNAPITVVILANLVPAFGFTLAYFVSKTMKKNIYTKAETETLKNAFAMGLFQITEGNLPIVLNDIPRALIATAVGNSVGGGLSMLWGCDSAIPAGGLLAVPTMSQPHMFLLAVLIGALLAGITFAFLKQNITDDNEQNIEPELNLKDIKFNE
ncbi:MAG TPA: PTS fructose transporter subunit IIC [Candidatus Anaerostipes excrementavium]|uniref:PTS fructose transporter subunit IIC n=1 Tax=Candidatus Anaerostipes excrementavium TaxID=2838463 RepID=A0A9D2B877_9FIRM|nr:PTS fructose transporter subunit IIC [uncultured Anaerostipes sp.]HIX66895.1 PTS fructose transporter subunit IIC [Candidatus Anaerostipes excrementavium]